MRNFKHFTLSKQPKHKAANPDHQSQAPQASIEIKIAVSTKPINLSSVGSFVTNTKLVRSKSSNRACVENISLSPTNNTT